jgi:hypothetical protein
MVCEKCGKELFAGYDTGLDDDEGGECPGCGRLLCNSCAGWKVLPDKTVCRECAPKCVTAIEGFTDDIVCSRWVGGIKTNVPRRIVRHSPSGFMWGYAGSGPADFALNILSMFIGQEEAERYYMDFKFEVVAAIPYEGGTVKRDFILEWIEAKRKEAASA